ncbi:uncharacterized protein V1518DRAFT_437268 [Limtongia smithiae]|uniref:uncharacterized protein n=1 Tax=Limtongia smithiae TaxID=1125753 RepID=UPI0034CFC46B
MKLSKVEHSILSAEQARATDERAICDFLTANSAAFSSVVRANQEREWLRGAQSAALDRERAALAAICMRREGARTAIELRTQELAAAQDELALARVKLAREKDAVRRARSERGARVQYEIARERQRIFADLARIYPIEPIVGRTLAFSIRGVELPNTFYDGCDDELLDIALGYTAHLVYFLALYLGTRLRYPVHPAGPRSFVEDPSSKEPGTHAFPLFRHGSFAKRFEYGVYYLNEDIEQMINSLSFSAVDIRHTLPNLKCLLLALQAVPSPPLPSAPSASTTT